MAANNELFPEPTFPITPISCPCKKRKKLFNFLRSKGRALRLLLYIAIFCVRLIVSLGNRTAERRRRQNAWVWQTWQDYYLRVLSGIHLTLMFFALLQKDLFKGMLSLVEGFSSNSIIVTLAHEVCRRLSSHVLLRKFTINVPTTGLLALETVGPFFQWLAHLNDKNNV